MNGSDNNNWIVQESVTGLDVGGREIMVNVRFGSIAEYEKVFGDLKSHIASLKAMPVRGSGFGPKSPPKEVKTWADVPSCPTHGVKMFVRAWAPDKDKPNEVKAYFWTCPEKDGDQYCRAKAADRADKSSFDQYAKLDQNERPKQAGASNGNGHSNAPAGDAHSTQDWLRRGKLIALLKQIPQFENDAIKVAGSLTKFEQAKVISADMTDVEIYEIVNRRASAAIDKGAA